MQYLCDRQARAEAWQRVRQRLLRTSVAARYLQQREFRLKNALTAADGVLLPLQCEYFALEGMQQLLNTIRLVRDRLNPSISLFGAILTMFDPRTKLGSEVVREVSEHFPRERFETVLPRNVRLAEAPSFGQTILEQDPRSPGALAYKQLAEEVIARAASMEAAYSIQTPDPPTSSMSPDTSSARWTHMRLNDQCGGISDMRNYRERERSGIVEILPPAECGGIFQAAPHGTRVFPDVTVATRRCSA